MSMTARDPMYPSPSSMTGIPLRRRRQRRCAQMTRLDARGLDDRGRQGRENDPSPAAAGVLAVFRSRPPKLLGAPR